MSVLIYIRNLKPNIVIDSQKCRSSWADIERIEIVVINCDKNEYPR